MSRSVWSHGPKAALLPLPWGKSLSARHVTRHRFLTRNVGSLVEHKCGGQRSLFLYSKGLFEGSGFRYL